MSDTPRTDAQLLPGLDLADAWDIVELCRTLERELAEAALRLSESSDQINTLKGGMIDLTVERDETISLLEGTLDNRNNTIEWQQGEIARLTVYAGPEITSSLVR